MEPDCDRLGGGGTVPSLSFGADALKDGSALGTGPVHRAPLPAYLDPYLDPPVPFPLPPYLLPCS